jgi:hypothetical protein
VRQDSVVNWADGAALAQVFSYETAKQNGYQFGNVTKVQERNSSSMMAATAAVMAKPALFMGPTTVAVPM